MTQPHRRVRIPLDRPRSYFGASWKIWRASPLSLPIFSVLSAPFVVKPFRNSPQRAQCPQRVKSPLEWHFLGSYFASCSRRGAKTISQSSAVHILFFRPVAFFRPRV